MTEPRRDKKRKPNAGKHPHPDWALAHVMVEWRRTTGPLLRKAYRLETGCDEQRELCAEAPKWIAGYARALESVS